MEKKKIRSSVRYSPSMHMYTNIGTRALYYYGLCSADDDDIDRQNAATDHVIIYYMPSSCTVLLPPLLLLLLQCSRALSSPRNRDQDVYGLLFIYILIFFSPLPCPRSCVLVYSWRTSLSAVRNKLRPRDLKNII